ncbi:phage portal protein, lambda family [Pseudoxanthomonas indica]|uniref:Phage portal protein, lambda family n=2 Tax=Pseudoxanthomonas indica TaxID=428993 RepID=A0A1T5K0T3_9GAMM|nr:phage portal protein, lambda family [Pseudoxanthomonas indica]
MQLAPGWAAARARSRMRAMAYGQAYEAAETTHLRRQSREMGSGNNVVQMTGTRLRNQARHLDRNHDIISGGLSSVIQNIIGPAGINVVPTPRDAEGNILEGVVDQIMPLYAAWSKRPEVTWMHDWASCQRLLGRTWLRDGECFVQELRGSVPYLEHGSAVPFSLELLEPDLVPLELDDRARRITQGVERNAWGRPVAYHVYRQHPGDPDSYVPETKRVSADLIRHLRTVDRIGQVRGISILASTFTRIEDLKDYEESERIAAKIAASMAAVIIKGDPTMYDPETAPKADRRMRFQPGMVFDNLVSGEDVKSIDSQRPNPNLEPYRNGQLRAIAAPMRISFSTLAKNYNGTYSAQRQELVEQYGAYGVLAYEFVSQMLRPVYERFVHIAVASGELILPPGVTPQSAASADYLPPPMPWINPVHEAQALRTMVRSGFKSATAVIAERGGRMYDTFEQIEHERRWARELGIVLDTDPALVADSGTAQQNQVAKPTSASDEDTQ